MHTGSRNLTTYSPLFCLARVGMVWDAQKKRGSSAQLISTQSGHPLSSLVPAVAAAAQANGGMLPDASEDAFNDDDDEEDFHDANADIAGV